MLHGEVTLPGSTSSVPTARHFVLRLLSTWGLDALSWNAALAVSELAANCALHARTEFTVSMKREAGGAVRIEVSDASSRVPVQRAYGDESTTGRGLRLLSEIAAEWGVTISGPGKTVWLRLDPTVPSGGGYDRAHEEAAGDLDALLAAFDDESPTATVRAFPFLAASRLAA